MAREAHLSLLKGREAARKISLAALESSFREWSGRAPFSAWESETATASALQAGETVDLPFHDVAAHFVDVAAGEPIPKGEGNVIAFGVGNGGSADADCTAVTWLFLDNDAVGDMIPLLELLDLIGAAYIAQRRGVKWHLHLPLATPIVVPQPFDPAWKKMHVARMEWATGVFSELAGLDLDLKAKKKVYGFDAAIPSIRILGICYPYARRKEEDEIPETRWRDGRALDLGVLLAETEFEYAPSTGTPRTISLVEAEGRLKALSAASLVRREFDDGKVAVICPWSTPVTTGGHEPGGETATVMFKSGVWFCAHETCRGRSWRDVDIWLADNEPAAREEAWRSQLLLNEKGGYKASIHNVLTILEHAPAWKGALRFDERAEKILITRDPPWGETRHYDDAYITRAAGWLASSEWRIEAFNLTAKALEAVAQKNRFDPVTDYLNSLQWDGVSRLDQWLTTYALAADSALTRELGKRWLISCVARGLHPECQVDHVLVLEGAQGAGKTQLFRALGGEWFSTITAISGVRAMEQLRGVWIGEMAELAAIRGAAIEALKSFISDVKDDYRSAYAHGLEYRPRRCVFGGSTNDSTYLDDEENRRFWPVRVGSELNIAELKRDRDQLFAEAKVRFHAGEPWHITSAALKSEAEAEQVRRRFVNPWEDKIAAFLEPLTVTTTHRVMQVALGIETKDQARHFKAVGRIIHHLGWEARRLRHGGDRARFLVKIGQDEASIRWADLGGPSLTIIKGGAVPAVPQNTQ